MSALVVLEVGDTRRMRVVLLGIVATSVVLAGVAAYGHVSARFDAGMFGGIALAVLALGGVSVWAVHSSRIERRRRDERVASIDAMLRALAARGTGEYLAGGAYHHPMIGTIPYCGSLRSGRWVVRLVEDEDGMRLEIVVADIAIAKLRAAPATARTLVDRLRAAKHRIAIVECPQNLVDPRAPLDASSRCLQITTAPALEGSEIEALLRDALAIVDAADG